MLQTQASLVGAFSLFIIAGVCQSSAHAADPSEVFRKKLRQMFGSDFKQYEWFSHPTSNFGLATMFVLNAQSDKPADRNQWCASLSCLGINNSSAPTNADQRLRMNGFADIGNGPPLQFDDEQERSVVVSGLVGQMLQIIGLALTGDEAAKIHTTVEFGRSAKRILNKQKLLGYLQSLPATSPVRQAMNESRLAIVIADLVVDSMTTTIQTTGKQRAAIDAYLQNAPSRLGRSPDLKFRITRSAKGEYKLTVQEPLILARLIVKKPFGGRSTEPAAVEERPAELDEWKDWVVAGPGK